jgi:[acyl-carrier-protein] S-malonyltransferase
MSLALLFSPQGSQVVGMGRDLAARWPEAAVAFERADAALPDWSVSGTCWNGPAEWLNDTRRTQPCLLTVSFAALGALGEATAKSGPAVRPAFVAGHSVGEYAALVAANVIGFEDALRLVSRRADLMTAAAVDGGMTAVIGLGRDAVAETIAAVASPAALVVANDNTPHQIVISGTPEALLAAEEPLRAAGARRLISLPVSGPFHSPWMAEVTEALAEAFELVAWKDAQPPVVSNVSAEPLTDAHEIRAALAEQVRSPVEWVRSVQRMVADGVDTFVELGPGSALSGMVRRIVPGARTLNVADPASLAATVQALGAVPAGVSV